MSLFIYANVHQKLRGWTVLYKRTSSVLIWNIYFSLWISLLVYSHYLCAYVGISTRRAVCTCVLQLVSVEWSIGARWVARARTRSLVDASPSRTRYQYCVPARCSTVHHFSPYHSIRVSNHIYWFSTLITIGSIFPWLPSILYPLCFNETTPKRISPLVTVRCFQGESGSSYLLTSLLLNH